LVAPHNDAEILEGKVGVPHDLPNQREWMLERYIQLVRPIQYLESRPKKQVKHKPRV
jgi:hypothetical protein